MHHQSARNIWVKVSRIVVVKVVLNQEVVRNQNEKLLANIQHVTFSMPHMHVVLSTETVIKERDFSSSS